MAVHPSRRMTRVLKPEHEVRREQDEWVCKCGKRWPVDEGRGHL